VEFFSHRKAKNAIFALLYVSDSYLFETGAPAPPKEENKPKQRGLTGATQSTWPNDNEVKSMKKVLFIISLLGLAGCDFPHSGGQGPPRPDRGEDGAMPPPEQTAPAQTAPAQPPAQ